MVVGWILVTHDGNGGLKSCDHRHGVGVNKGVKWGSEEDCYLKRVESRALAARRKAIADCLEMVQQSTPTVPTHVRAMRAVFIVLLVFVAYKFYQQHIWCRPNCELQPAS